MDFNADALRFNLTRTSFDRLMSVIFGTVTSIPLGHLRPEREVSVELGFRITVRVRV